MPLIKSNQLIQAGTAVVAGDQIVAETGAPTPERAAAVLPPIPNLVIPSLDLPDASMADFFAADPEPAAAEPVAEAPPVETAPPEPEVVENPEVADFLSAFATEREALLEDARTEAEVAAQEATGQLGAPDAGLELDEAASAIRATYPEGTPAFEAAMESVTPYIEQQAASALDLIVQIERSSDGGRRVTSISEIVGMEGDVIQMQEIYQFVRQGLDIDGHLLGQHRPTGIRPKCADALRTKGIELPVDLFQGMAGAV